MKLPRMASRCWFCNTNLSTMLKLKYLFIGNLFLKWFGSVIVVMSCTIGICKIIRIMLQQCEQRIIFMFTYRTSKRKENAAGSNDCRLFRYCDCEVRNCRYLLTNLCNRLYMILFYHNGVQITIRLSSWTLTPYG